MPRPGQEDLKPWGQEIDRRGANSRELCRGWLRKLTIKVQRPGRDPGAAG
jgi:hypothetical protein